MTRSQLRRLLNRVVKDDRGAAAVEFGLLLPVLVLLYAVGFEVCQAATVKRKLTDTTVQIANLTSQYTKVAKSDISTIMNASSQTMTPFSNSALGIVLSEVNIDSSGNATVCWSEAYLNGVAFTGTPITHAPVAPASFATPNSSYIVVQSTYAYTPVIAGNLVAPMTLTGQSFMLPRDSASIPCSDCTATPC
jgi:Flp pilus assembly protein TadG